MLKPVQPKANSCMDNEARRRIARPIPQLYKRAHSSSPVPVREKRPILPKKGERRCQSLSPSVHTLKKSLEQFVSAGPDGMDPQTFQMLTEHDDKDPAIPQCVLSKVLRVLATKKREFIKMRKSLVTQQNSLLEYYAQLKEIEARAGVGTEESLGEVRVLSVSGWPAHDLLLLIRDDLELPLKQEITGVVGPNILQQLTAQLNPIPEEVMSICAEIMTRRLEMLNILRSKYRSDRATYSINLEWKTKNLEFDAETEKLQKIVAGTTENLKAKVKYSLELAKVPWIDRGTITKKVERIQKENLVLQNKIDELVKKEQEKQPEPQTEGGSSYQAVCEELSKERAAREALKEVVTAAESMLRVARSRIATLERQNKDARAELEAARKRHRDLEQLVNRLANQYRHRETSYDARSKKLIESSKHGEMTIEALSRQRDALELRVKELRDQTEIAERTAQVREAEQRARLEALQVKVAEQEKVKTITDEHAITLESKVKELEEQLQSLQERSVKLVDIERRRCMEYVPSKENEPSDRETDIWKELQVTRASLARVEDELRQSRADKDSFLNSLSRIAQGEGPDKVQEKIATELVDREKKILKLQQVIDEQRENEKRMEQSLSRYETQLGSLRFEVKRLRNYDNYNKEVSYQDLQTELLELHMQVESLSRERKSLVTAAASRALMLERHERSADLFARMIRARRDLSALLDGSATPPSMDESCNLEISKSLSLTCASAADTWSALRAERARVLRLESAVIAQSLQLEREGQARTQLERRRATLERELIRAQHSSASDGTILSNRNPNYSGRLWI